MLDNSQEIIDYVEAVNPKYRIEITGKFLELTNLENTITKTIIEVITEFKYELRNIRISENENKIIATFYKL